MNKDRKVKKLIAIILISVVIIIAAIAGVLIFVEKSKPKQFKTDEVDGGLSISELKYENPSSVTEIMFPSRIGWDKVVWVSTNLYDNYTNVETLIFEDGIKEISGPTFPTFPNVKDVVIPESVEYIERVYNSDEFLSESEKEGKENSPYWRERVVSTDGYEINGSLMGYRDTREEYVVADNITSICTNTFAGTERLKKVVINKGCKRISFCAFGNSCIEEVVIPDTVEYIGTLVFYKSSVKELYIPETVKTIDYSAFSGIEHITYYGSAEGAPWGAKSMN